MRVGCPIRISTDQRLLAAPRGFSQRATSFIASWCQGIHRMPLLRSNATHHAQEPSTPPSLPEQQHGHPVHGAPTFAHTWSAPPSQRAQDHNVSEQRHRIRGAATRIAQATTGQTASRQRPETHQNLIHSLKEPRRQTAPPSRHASRPAPCGRAAGPAMPNSDFTATITPPPARRPDAGSRSLRSPSETDRLRTSRQTLRGIAPFGLLRSPIAFGEQEQWRRPGSNR